MNKRGEIVGFETVIFTMLNLIFFCVMLFFIYRVGTGAFLYEQAYAKEIVLVIDNSQPEMKILIDMNDAVDIAKKNNQDKMKIFSIDENENKVIVSLTGKGGYGFRYFSNYTVDYKMNGNYLELNIGEKNEIK